MNTRLKNLTAILLAGFYGLVGLTGESLHYLSEDVNLAAIQDKVADLGGYFHFHGPDHHVHFHHHGEVEVASNSKAPTDDRNGNLARAKQFHSQHACPWLSVVSTLKLGSGGVVATNVDLEALEASPSVLDLCHAFELASYYLARGPPLAA